MKLAFRVSRFGTKFIERGVGAVDGRLIGARSDDDDNVVPGVRRGLLIDFSFFLSLESWTSPWSGCRFFFSRSFLLFLYFPLAFSSPSPSFSRDITGVSPFTLTWNWIEANWLSRRDTLLLWLFFPGVHDTNARRMFRARRGARARLPSFPKDPFPFSFPMEKWIFCVIFSSGATLPFSRQI